MDITHDQLQNAFVLFIGCLFVFVLIREVICWYWKINKGILLQEKILKQLMEINKDNKAEIQEKFLHKWVTNPDTTVDIDKL